MSAAVKTGLDILREDSFASLSGMRLAVTANPSSVDYHLDHIVDLLFESENCSLVTVFAPEHGVRGALQDMEEVESSVDKRTGLPVVSLYGNSLKSLTPTNESLDDVDCIVFDLQDIGSRYYTYAQTLAFIMLAASRLKKKVVVIDRPNPIDGLTIEGAPLTESCRSFCGLYPTANRHALTMGELATMFLNGIKGEHFNVAPIDCDVEIIKMRGWKRDMLFPETGLPWILPSPNMPTLEAALTYPGTCLFEGTNISEGRGTTKPFEFFGAPYIDGYTWIEHIEKEDCELAGASLRPVTFIPQISKWAGRTCGGIQIHIRDQAAFKPLRWTLAMISAAAKAYPSNFNWRQQTYEFVKDTPAIDLLYGSNNLRKIVDRKKSIAPLIEEMENSEKHFEQERQALLLY